MAAEKKEKAKETKKETKPVKFDVSKEQDVAKLKAQLRNTLIDIRTGKDKGTAKIRMIKKQIARILTKENDRQNNKD